MIKNIDRIIYRLYFKAGIKGKTGAVYALVRMAVENCGAFFHKYNDIDRFDVAVGKIPPLCPSELFDQVILAY